MENEILKKKLNKTGYTADFNANISFVGIAFACEKLQCWGLKTVATSDAPILKRRQSK